MEEDRLKLLGLDPPCPSDRRAPWYNGNLLNARQICKRGLDHASFGDCSNLVNTKARVTGRQVVCSAQTASEFLHIYNRNPGRAHHQDESAEADADGEDS